MEIEIIKQETQPLFRRTKVEARITFQGATPSRKAVIAAVAKATKAAQDVVIVKKVITGYGDQEAAVSASVYDDRKALESLERKALLKKHEFAEEKKEEAPAAEKPVEAVPAEEKKAEAKSEEKPAEKGDA